MDLPHDCGTHIYVDVTWGGWAIHIYVDFGISIYTGVDVAQVYTREWVCHGYLHGCGWATGIYMGVVGPQGIYMGVDGPQVFTCVWLGHRYLHGCGWAIGIYMGVDGPQVFTWCMDGPQVFT